MSQATIHELMQRALQQCQAGQLGAAESTCRQILAVQPNDPEVLKLLGVIAASTGRSELAEKLLSQASTIAPNIPEVHFNLAMVLLKQGQLDRAIESYHRTIALKPNFVEAVYYLGIALAHKGEIDQGIASFRRALELRPLYPEALNSLGNAWLEKGQIDQAIECYQNAVTIKADFAEAHYNLGNAMRSKGRFDQAINCYERALALKPDYAEALNNLGNVLQATGAVDKAISCFNRALVLNPNYTQAHYNLGIAWMHKGLIDEAIESYHRALELKPNRADTLDNLAVALVAKRDLARADQFFRAAIAAQGDHASAHWNLGLLLLLQGDYELGLPLYEWRKKLPSHSSVNVAAGGRWDGTDLSGRRILIYCEQGFGDAIQCFRYIPLVTNRGGKIVLVVPPELRRLAACLEGVEDLVTQGEVLPEYDVQCSIMSLPLAFKTTAQTIPANVPHLTSNPELKRVWRSRLPNDKRLKVGLVWLGRSYPDPHRAVAPTELALLAKLERVWLCSLQKETSGVMPDLQMADFSNQLGDFAETAALIDNLDLVITIDTAVAHLAGALGKQVWVLLKSVPDWRWMLDREDSPWYPTMRLFRQTTRGQWQSPIDQIIKELNAMTGN